MGRGTVCLPALVFLISGWLSVTGTANPAFTRELTPQNVSAYAVYEFANDGGGISWIKFAVLLKEDGAREIFFQNSHSFRFHSDFLQTLPEFKGFSRDQIDKATLFANGRRALLGTLILSNTPGGKSQAEFDLVTQDELSLDQVRKVRKQVLDVAAQVVGDLAYRPVREVRESVRRELAGYERAGIPVVFPKQTEGVLVYAPGWSVGKIKRVLVSEVEQWVREGRIHSSDILLMDEIPRDPPPAAGYIVATESSPNSHAALLSQMMGTIFIYSKGALTDPLWERLEKQGEPVYVEVSGLDRRVRVQGPLKEGELEALASLKRPTPLGMAKRDLSFTEIVSIDQLSKSDADKVGAKAANLAFLRRLLGPSHVAQTVPIPFHYYKQFLMVSKVGTTGETLEDFLARELKGLDQRPLPEVLKALERIRSAIQTAEAPETFWEPIFNGLRRYFAEDSLRLRFRSSSNVEDNPRFNGAGLYESHGAALGKPKKVRRAIQKVWASLFTDRGYSARRAFGIAEESAAMAIAVQPAFENEVANGVSIFKEERGMRVSVVTGFPGDQYSVTNPPAGARPETTTITSFGENHYSVQVEAPSTELPLGRQLLLEQEYHGLYDLEFRVFQAWKQAMGEKEGLKLDFEWKVMKDAQGQRSVWLKQVREVPDSSLDRAITVSDTLIIPDRNAVLRGSTGEDPSGFLALTAQRKEIRFEHRLFAFDQSLADQIPFESLSIRRWDGQWEKIPLETVRSFYQETPWASPQWGEAGAPREIRQKSWRLQIPDPDFPSLEVQFDLREERLKGSTALVTPLATFSNLTAVARVQRKDVPLLAAKEGDPVLQWQLLGFQENKEGNRKPYGVRHRFTGKDVQIDIHATTSFGGFDKTMFLDIDSLQISGLGQDVVKLKGPDLGVYAPAHHNFWWEYVFDLHPSEIRGGRYLQIRSSQNGTASSCAVLLVTAAGAEIDLGTVEQEPPVLER